MKKGEIENEIFLSKLKWKVFFSYSHFFLHHCAQRTNVWHWVAHSPSHLSRRGKSSSRTERTAWMHAFHLIITKTIFNTEYDDERVHKVTRFKYINRSRHRLALLSDKIFFFVTFRVSRVIHSHIIFYLSLLLSHDRKNFIYQNETAFLFSAVCLSLHTKTPEIKKRNASVRESRRLHY